MKMMIPGEGFDLPDSQLSRLSKYISCATRSTFRYRGSLIFEFDFLRTVHFTDAMAVRFTDA